MALRDKGSSSSKPKGKGLSIQTHSGLSEARMAAAGGGNSKRIFLPMGKPVMVQFLDTPDEMKEYDIHSFQSGGKWRYVPCTGHDDCPLCNDDDPEVAKQKYRFCCNAYDVKRKKVGIVEGPQALAVRIMGRFKGRPETFKKKVFMVTKMNTTPVSFDIDVVDDKYAFRVKEAKLDLDEFVKEEHEAFITGNAPVGKKKSKSSLDAYDDEDEADDEEEVHTKDELMEMEWGPLKRLALSLDIDITDKKRRALVREIMEAEE